ncbi:PIG-L deacetylase family protein [Guptibacillus hwajinpoensis]|uniref:LmbE family N-acetylglucosaminyl deacetylase n=1 Tax=Guptibacillus hwajinpoensis TaxID=208199 RepID=A0ABU0JXZ2_9BACL|nr:PIG-L family deacetylase [Alkalihalobacillus hemicentroti]MDQ0481948.1 LmbE family N-acetylglucosaminyl deacetylase [Alkalihalobacillus hemicentroti]
MSRTIMFVFAHPDDETFTSGGTILELAQQTDTKTVLYSATPGDAGKCGEPPLCTPENLASTRRKELQTAAKLLRIDQLVIDDFKDGKLNELPSGVLKNEVLKQIHIVKPEVVVTFPPHGLSGHSDHKAIQQATLEAVQDSSSGVKELYYTTFPQSLAKETGNPAFSDPDETISLVKSFSQDHMNEVKEALLAHKTQHLSVERVFPTIIEDTAFMKFNNKEYFIRAWQHPQYNSDPLLT